MLDRDGIDGDELFGEPHRSESQRQHQIGLAATGNDELGRAAAYVDYQSATFVKVGDLRDSHRYQPRLFDAWEAGGVDGQDLVVAWKPGGGGAHSTE